MVYTFGQADDQVEHIKFHKNFVSGVKFMVSTEHNSEEHVIFCLHVCPQGWKNERVVRQFHDGRIIVILRTDPKHHLKKVRALCARYKIRRDCSTPLVHVYLSTSVVLVWLHLIRFSFSKKAIKERKFSFS